LKDGAWSHFGTEDGLPNLYVWSAVEDSDGRLWGGTWGSGVFMQNGNRFERVPGVDSNLVAYAVFPAPNGGLWVGAASGLLSYDAGKVHPILSTNLPVSRDVRTMVVDDHGAMWFGMFGGGLACFERTAKSVSSESVTDCRAILSNVSAPMPMAASGSEPMAGVSTG